MLLADAPHLADHLDQLAARDRDVLADLERADLGQCDAGHPPRLPQLAPLRLVLRGEDVDGAPLGAQLSGPRQLFGHPVAVAVVLDEQSAADAFRELERRARPNSAHGWTVEQLTGAGQEAGIEDRLHGARRGVLVGK